MEPYLEVLWFILLPILLATVINRLANKKRVGNVRIVLYKLF